MISQQLWTMLRLWVRVAAKTATVGDDLANAAWIYLLRELPVLWAIARFITNKRVIFYNLC
jgi:predicted DNA repair protein MutK